MSRSLAYGLLVVVLVLALTTSSKALGFVRGKPVELELGSIGGGFALRKDAAGAFNAMAAAASADDCPLQINSAFRTHEEQVDLQTTRAEFAAPVDYSPHQAGLAVDIESGNGTNAAYGWLCDNAGDYGFKRSVTREPWHWEYVNG